MARYDKIYEWRRWTLLGCTLTGEVHREEARYAAYPAAMTLLAGLLDAAADLEVLCLGLSDARTHALPARRALLRAPPLPPAVQGDSVLLAPPLRLPWAPVLAEVLWRRVGVRLVIAGTIPPPCLLVPTPGEMYAALAPVEVRRNAAVLASVRRRFGPLVFVKISNLARLAYVNNVLASLRRGMVEAAVERDALALMLGEAGAAVGERVSRSGGEDAHAGGQGSATCAVPVPGSTSGLLPPGEASGQFRGGNTNNEETGGDNHGLCAADGATREDGEHPTLTHSGELPRLRLGNAMNSQPGSPTATPASPAGAAPRVRRRRCASVTVTAAPASDFYLVHGVVVPAELLRDVSASIARDYHIHISAPRRRHVPPHVSGHGGATLASLSNAGTALSLPPPPPDSYRSPYLSHASGSPINLQRSSTPPMPPTMLLSSPSSSPPPRSFHAPASTKSVDAYLSEYFSTRWTDVCNAAIRDARISHRQRRLAKLAMIISSTRDAEDAACKCRAELIDLAVAHETAGAPLATMCALIIAQKKSDPELNALYMQMPRYVWRMVRRARCRLEELERADTISLNSFAQL